MKKLLIAATLCAAAVPALAQIDVNINIGDPGFYGRITNPDLRPRVYVTQPVIVERTVQYRGDPVYLRVPPGHRKNWSKHCYKYDACGQRVLFVRDDWYTNSYAPRYRDHVRVRDSHRGDRQEYRVERNDSRYDRNDRHDRHDRHDKADKHDKHDKHGKGNGHGNGKGHGKDKHHGKGHGKDKH